MLLRKTTLLLSLIAALSFATANAGQIDPSLRHHLASLNDSEHVRVLIYLDQQADIRSLHRQHLRTSASRAQSHREVVQALQQTAKTTQPSLLNYLQTMQKSGAIENVKSFWIVNMFAASVAKEEIFRIAALSEVSEIEMDVPIQMIESEPEHDGTAGSLDENLITSGLLAIQADRVWHELGITGQGRLVSSLDTGVRLSHPALQSRWRGNSEPVGECWFDPLNFAYPFDYDSFATSWSRGHGTHTMGTMCGLSESTHDTIGVAWGARWIAGQGLYATSEESFISGIMDIYEWMSDPDGNPNTIDDVPDVSSNSWGVEAINTGYLDCDPRWNEAIFNMEAAGVVAVFACGNSGPDVQSLGSPANISNDDYFNFSVGAVDAVDPEWPYEIASFSSRGPSDCDTTVIKPEIVAPGVNVFSGYARNFDYGTESGTSMACPHVAGVVALMREADPDLSGEMTKEILMRTARDLGTPGEDNNYGHGMLDAFGAVSAVMRGWGTVAGTVVDASGQPLVTTLTLANGQLTHSDAAGEFIFYLPGDSNYSITASRWGYVAATVDVSVTAHQTTTTQITLQLEQQGDLDGVVLDERFLPISGATVRVLNTPFPAQTTAADGLFHFVLPNSQTYGTYALRIEVFGLVDTLFDLAIEQGQVTWVEHRMIEPAHLPLGPDGYGYTAYDRFDSENPALYNWIEIEPDSGGSGTRLDFSANDQTRQVDLPFSFVYYGAPYSQISVCCNGWIAMGSTTATDYRNWPIPSSSGPPAVIAPFWEDFDPRNGGSISYYHDSERGCFIVQFNRLAQAAPANTFETFQVLLYNPEQNPTLLGDGDIVFQYKHISDPTGCTIGIEDSTETIGLEYLFDDIYNERASTIDNETAIRFTTGYSATTGAISGRVTLHPSPAVVEAVVVVGNRFIQTDGRGYYTLAGLPAGVYDATVDVTGYEHGVIEHLTVTEGLVLQDQDFNLYHLDSPTGLFGIQNDQGEILLSWISPFPMTDGLRIATDSEQKKSGKTGKSAQVTAWKEVRADATNSLDELTGFHIYRDGSLLTDAWADTFYLDTPAASGVYEYWLTAVYAGGLSDTSGHVTVDYISANDPHPDGAIPGQFALFQNSPNPFNPATEIRFDLPLSTPVELTVYNVLGQTAVTKLIDTILPAGTHHVMWNGRDSQGRQLSTGLYVYRLKAGSFIQSRKMILLR